MSPRKKLVRALERKVLAGERGALAALRRVAPRRAKAVAAEKREVARTKREREKKRRSRLAKKAAKVGALFREAKKTGRIPRELDRLAPDRAAEIRVGRARKNKKEARAKAVRGLAKAARRGSKKAVEKLREVAPKRAAELEEEAKTRLLEERARLDQASNQAAAATLAAVEIRERLVRTPEDAPARPTLEQTFDEALAKDREAAARRAEAARRFRAAEALGRQFGPIKEHAPWDGPPAHKFKSAQDLADRLADTRYGAMTVEGIRVHRTDAGLVVLGTARNIRTGETVKVQGYEVRVRKPDRPETSYFFWGDIAKLSAFTPAAVFEQTISPPEEVGLERPETEDMIVEWSDP